MKLGLAVFALAALSVAQLATLVHHVTVEHATCPEHGELIHGARSGASDHGQRAAGAGVSSTAEEAHAHDACLVATELPRTEIAYGDSAAPSSSVGEVLSAPVSIDSCSSDLFKVAPKASPPAWV